MDLGIRHPFFNPLWRRIAMTIFLVLWTAWEISNKAPGWALLIGGITVACVYTFFFAWEDGEKGED